MLFSDREFLCHVTTLESSLTQPCISFHHPKELFTMEICFIKNNNSYELSLTVLTQFQVMTVNTKKERERGRESNFWKKTNIESINQPKTELSEALLNQENYWRPDLTTQDFVDGTKQLIQRWKDERDTILVKMKARDWSMSVALCIVFITTIM